MAVVRYNHIPIYTNPTKSECDMISFIISNLFVNLSTLLTVFFKDQLLYLWLVYVCVANALRESQKNIIFKSKNDFNLSLSKFVSKKWQKQGQKIGTD